MIFFNLKWSAYIWTNYTRLLLGSYFYVVGICYEKTHITCIWVELSGFENIKKYFGKVFSSGSIEEMKIV